MRTILTSLLALILAAIILALAVAWDRQGEVERDGEIVEAPRSPELVAQREQQQTKAAEALNASDAKQILFGDVHAHTTFSMDAFAWSLPLLGGEGIHPPADACDYARHVADLDFWALTDHAESLTPRHWRMTKEAVRACNAAAGDSANPDLVTFLGWEWTQMGNTRETHYGHRNVFLRDTAEDQVPARPIAADGVPFRAMRQNSLNAFQTYVGPYLSDFENRQRQVDQQKKQADLRSWPVCEDGLPVRELPADCIELAATPKELFAKLADWGFPVMAVPHGTSWGFYTPPGYNWDKQIAAEQHDPERQRLIEVFSGHGNAEEYRDWRAVRYDDEGNPACPKPSEDYLPACHRAGELIRQRCDDPNSQECEQRVQKAEQNYLAAGRAGHITVPSVGPADWLNAGQCRDCYLPPLNHRPAGSVQYILAKRNFEGTDSRDEPFGLRFGFIGSSDNHNARPGNGFKEVDRTVVTDTYGAQNAIVQDQFVDAAKRDPDLRWSQPFELGGSPHNFLQVNESERQASFFYSGGLVAVHSAGRNRNAIWDALQRREVYATSGERILLWFDLLNPQDGAQDRIKPMGSIVAMSGEPRFRVRAIGAFEQQPGCRAEVIDKLGEERLQKLSGGECHNPGDNRHAIERIEVVRIRPQREPAEPIGELIDDPWLVHECPQDSTGCEFSFSDSEFAVNGRETIYYVRSLQAPTPTINADSLRCVEDETGRCTEARPCYGDTRTAADDDCTAAAAERAWSSPIYVRHSDTQ